MRAALIALVLMTAPAAAAAQEGYDIGGAWRGEQVGRFFSIPNYLDVTLEALDGQVSGSGHINLCAGCRGFAHHAVAWEGRLDGDRIDLRGVYPDRSFESEVRFAGQVVDDGQRIVGVVSKGRRDWNFVLVREQRAEPALH